MDTDLTKQIRHEPYYCEAVRTDEHIPYESKTIEELFINVKRYARANLTKEGFEEFMKAFEQLMKAA